MATSLWLISVIALTWYAVRCRVEYANALGIADACRAAEEEAVRKWRNQRETVGRLKAEVQRLNEEIIAAPIPTAFGWVE